MDLLTVCLHLLFLIGFGYGQETCGIVYVGSLPSSLSSLYPLVGVYHQNQVSAITNISVTGEEHVAYPNPPSFTHESGAFFLYYIPQLFGGNWAVSLVDGSDSLQDILVITQSLATHPVNVEKGTWHVVQEAETSTATTAGFTPVSGFSVTCTTLRTECHSGQLQLGGLSSFAGGQRQVVEGTYILTSSTSELRPVYRRTTQPHTYLYHHQGMWVVGSDLEGLRMVMFAVDSAMRPEFIREHWVVYRPGGLYVDSGVDISCLEEDDANELMLGLTCQTTVCLNGGRCESTPDGRPCCICPHHTFGSHCELNVSCGDPPLVEKGHVTLSSGSDVMSVVTYACSPGFRLEGSAGVVCQVDGTWSQAPECHSVFNTPMIPIPPGLLQGGNAGPNSSGQDPPGRSRRPISMADVLASMRQRMANTPGFK